MKNVTFTRTVTPSQRPTAQAGGQRLQRSQQRRDWKPGRPRTGLALTLGTTSFEYLYFLIGEKSVLGVIWSSAELLVAHRLGTEDELHLLEPARVADQLLGKRGVVSVNPFEALAHAEAQKLNREAPTAKWTWNGECFPLAPRNPGVYDAR